jgi:putative SOS response-associated peptidase YedK
VRKPVRHEHRVTDPYAIARHSPGSGKGLTPYYNATVGELHDRMPVILQPQDWQIWL